VRITDNFSAWRSLLAHRPDLARHQFSVTLVEANFLARRNLGSASGAIRARPNPGEVSGPARARFRLRTASFPDHCRVTAEVGVLASQKLAFLRGSGRAPTKETLWLGEDRLVFRLSAANGWQQEQWAGFGPVVLREPPLADIGGYETRLFALEHRIRDVRLRCDSGAE
jgi:hypothetical protein